MSEAEKMADYLGFEVVYLDGFAYIKEQGEQGPEIKREATLEERTLWTGLGAVSEELEALKRAISDAEPVHFRALLDADQAPQQLKTSMHVVGFHDRKAAEHFVIEQSDFYGWRYTIEPLYTLKGIK